MVSYTISMDQEILRLYQSLSTLVDLKKSFITLRAEETNHLEFKEKHDRQVPQLSESDKKNFSKALSAFSNADGGLLIWGISTRKKSGRDCAFSLKAISNVNAFAESLRDSLLDSTIPRNHRVVIKTIANMRGNGFVVCMIPAADEVPIRAMNAEREYWIRTDGRNMKLEHYQIKDMMLRHAYPDLDFEISVTEENIATDQVMLSFKFHNRGKALAKYWGYFIKMPHVELVDIRECIDVSHLNPGTTTVSGDGGFNSVIHPNNIKLGVGSIIIRKNLVVQNMAVHVSWYCENMSTKSQVFNVQIPSITEIESKKI